MEAVGSRAGVLSTVDPPTAPAAPGRLRRAGAAVTRWRFRDLAVSICLAVVALSSSAAPAAARPHVRRHRITWLAAGDSYASGQGLTHLAGKCARAAAPSATWARVARGALAAAGYPVDRPRVVACTGATTTDFMDKPDAAGRPEWTPLRTKGHRFDLVTFSFGGDNVGFVPVLTACFLRQSGCTNNRVRGRIARFGRRYVAFLERVATTVAVAGGHVVVMGYPDLFGDPSRWSEVDRVLQVCQGFDVHDVNLIRGWAGDLNATLGEGVSAANKLPAAQRNDVTFSFVDVVSGGGGVSPSDPNLFEPASGTGHELCSAGDQSWLNGLMLPKGLRAAASGTVVTPRSLHPTQQGEDAMGHLAAEVIGRLVWAGSPPLGVRWKTGGPGSVVGHGKVEPPAVDNGGGPTSVATGIVWQTWGGSEAKGTGVSTYVPPGAASVAGTGVRAEASIVALDRGTCGGRYAYRRLVWYFPEYGQSLASGTASAWQLCPAPWLGSHLQVTPSSLGPVHVGMRIDGAQVAAGGGQAGFFTDVGDGYDGIPGTATRYQHLYVGVGAGTRVRCVGAALTATRSSAQVVTTRRGLALGDTVAKLLALYGSQVRHVSAPRTGGITDFSGYLLPGSHGEALAFVVGATRRIVEIAAGHVASPNGCTG